jgi:hypothetical protein
MYIICLFLTGLTMTLSTFFFPLAEMALQLQPVIRSDYVTMVDNNRDRSHIAVRPVYAFLEYLLYICLRLKSHVTPFMLFS